MCVHMHALIPQAFYTHFDFSGFATNGHLEFKYTKWQIPDRCHLSFKSRCSKQHDELTLTLCHSWCYVCPLYVMLYKPPAH